MTLEKTTKRKHMINIFLAVFLVVSGISAPNIVHAGSPLSAVGEGVTTIAPMLEKTMPGVVNISTLTHVRAKENPLFSDPFFRHFFNVPNTPKEREAESLGSGVIIDAQKGYVLTNNHVIEKADKIRVTLRDGRSFDAKVIGSDSESDIAILQIKASSLTALPMANSDKLRVGDFVVAIGNPFGLGQTVTSGIVSALGRSDLGIEGYEDFIQTDASINPGNSGGALVNFKGQLVGINTAILAPSGGNVGIGFAIPINMVKEVTQQLIRYGEVKRGQLGILIQDINGDLAHAFHIEEGKGVLVSQVLKNSAADAAGIKQGDIITSVNGKPVTSSGELRNYIGMQRVGNKINLTILRKGKTKQVTATIKAQKAIKVSADSISDKLKGATIANMQDLNSHQQGVQIVDIKTGSEAWRAGLRKGDIIVSANQQNVKTIEDLRAAVRSHSDSLLLNVQRQNAALFILIR
jgi:serine protease DegQ